MPLSCLPLLWTHSFQHFSTLSITYLTTPHFSTPSSFQFHFLYLSISLIFLIFFSNNNPRSSRWSGQDVRYKSKQMLPIATKQDHHFRLYISSCSSAPFLGLSAHSNFPIPVSCRNSDSCTVQAKTQFATDLPHVDSIILDEVLVRPHCLIDVLHHTIQDLTRGRRPIGKKLNWSLKSSDRFFPLSKTCHTRRSFMHYSKCVSFPSNFILCNSPKTLDSSKTRDWHCFETARFWRQILPHFQTFLAFGKRSIPCDEQYQVTSSSSIALQTDVWGFCQAIFMVIESNYIPNAWIIDTSFGQHRRRSLKKLTLLSKRIYQWKWENLHAQTR